MMNNKERNTEIKFFSIFEFLLAIDNISLISYTKIPILNF